MITDWALVLEGGGMRGVFTSGVLDYFMDKDIYFPYTIGVSAGACNGLSYVSRQRGRAKISNIDLLDKYHYISTKFLWTNRSILNMNFLFDEMPNKVLPYDFDTYFSSSDRFIMVTSNCETGKAEYFEEKKSSQRLLRICRASSSLPFVAPIVRIDGKPMLDGGICDPIPYRKVREDGYNRMVLVLTRNKGYRKVEKDMKLFSFLYPKYPALRNRLCNRVREYNKTLDEIESMEKNDEVIVIRPRKPLEVDRIEHNIKKLTDLYNEGYCCAESALANIDL
ncbi:patatin-like phospholipase family protein [Coprobacter sp.]